MRKLLILMTAALAMMISAGPGSAAPAVSAKDRSQAAAALKSQITLLTLGQNGKAWDQLHPVDQALVTRAHYVGCASRAAGMTLSEFAVQDAYWESTQIAGTSIVARSLALTVRYALSGRTATTTFHEIKVGKRWRFTLSNPEQYANGACP